MTRTILLTAILCIAFNSCKKEVNDPGETRSVKMDLQSMMDEKMFSKLDFDRMIYSKDDSNSFLRIAFVHEKMSEHFVLLEMEKGARTAIAGGAIITMARADGAPIPTYFLKESLDGKVITRSTITGGYIDAYHPLTRVESMMLPYKELPEVIVVANYNDVYNLMPVSPTELYYLSALLQPFGDSDPIGYYGVADPLAGGGAGAYVPGGYTGGPLLPAAEEKMMAFEGEYVYSEPAIDIVKYFNCFNNVPSAGATYSMTLCADVPSNTNPGASADYSAMYGGHTFLTITKINGAEKISQSFGFYPKDMPGKSNTFSPLASAMKDNGVREINASLEMKINESEFQKVKENAITLSSRKYELADYNCTHYAMDVFNSVRANPVVIPEMTVYLPGTPGPYVPGNTGTVSIKKSPQMLFLTLKDRKDKNEAEAANIKIDLSDKYRSPESNGSCN